LQGGPRLAAVAHPFPQGAVGNPGGRSQKKQHALLAYALNEPAFVTIDGERRKITKREAVVHQVVNKSATADLRATNMLLGRMLERERLAAAPPAERPSFGAADKKVIDNL
jgi:hypothetical protein